MYDKEVYRRGRGVTLHDLVAMLSRERPCYNISIVTIIPN